MRIIDLVELVEDALLLVLRDTAPCISHRDRPVGTVRCEFNSNTAFLGITQCIGQQVAHDPVEMFNVGNHMCRPVPDQFEMQLLFCCFGAEFQAKLFEVGLQIAGRRMGFHDACIEFRHVQQGVHLAGQVVDSSVEVREDLRGFGTVLAPHQCARKERERMDRLSQVVACGGQKTGFRLIRSDSIIKSFLKPLVHHRLLVANPERLHEKRRILFRQADEDHPEKNNQQGYANLGQQVAFGNGDHSPGDGERDDDGQGKCEVGLEMTCGRTNSTCHQACKYECQDGTLCQCEFRKKQHRTAMGQAVGEAQRNSEALTRIDTDFVFRG